MEPVSYNPVEKWIALNIRYETTHLEGSYHDS